MLLHVDRSQLSRVKVDVQMQMQMQTRMALPMVRSQKPMEQDWRIDEPDWKSAPTGLLLLCLKSS